MSTETPQYVDVDTPNATQIRSAVRGAENYRYYERRRSTWWIRLLFTVLFFGLWLFVYLMMFTDWSW